MTRPAENARLRSQLALRDEFARVASADLDRAIEQQRKAERALENERDYAARVVGVLHGCERDIKRRDLLDVLRRRGGLLVSVHGVEPVGEG